MYNHTLYSGYNNRSKRRACLYCIVIIITKCIIIQKPGKNIQFIAAPTIDHVHIIMEYVFNEHIRFQNSVQYLQENATEMSWSLLCYYKNGLWHISTPTVDHDEYAAGLLFTKLKAEIVQSQQRTLSYRQAGL